MGYESNDDLAGLVQQITKASASIAAGDTRFDRRLDDFETNLNDLMKHRGRPGFSGDVSESADLERKSAQEMCALRFAERSPKVGDVAKAYRASNSEIDEAMAARRAFSHVVRHGSPAKLDAFEQKSLSAFSFAGTGMLLPPERQAQA